MRVWKSLAGNDRSMRATCALLAVILLAVAVEGRAGNGLNTYGVGSRSLGMAGADLAVPNGVLSLAPNPAGLDSVARHEASGYFESYWQPFEHRDDLGNNVNP